MTINTRNQNLTYIRLYEQFVNYYALLQFTVWSRLHLWTSKHNVPIYHHLPAQQK